MSSVSSAESSRAVERGSLESPLRLRSLAVLIPAWQPDGRLVGLVRALVGAGFGWVVVVDDGSRAGCGPVFGAVAAIERTVVLRHERNFGKGRALKTGFGYLLGLGGEVAGVVTADADGQHTPEDIVRVGEVLLGSGARPVLGVRGFAGDVPRRSRVGNGVSRWVFAALTGVRVTDTQTGLRGLPRGVLPELIGLRGERYEYEMTMLAHLCREGPRPLEVPIATVYLEGNRGSHFHPIWDSVRVFAVLLRSGFRRGKAR